MVARGRGRAQSVSYQFFSLTAVIVIICLNSKIIHMARQASSVEHGQHNGSCAVFSVAVFLLGIRSKLRISFLRDEQAFASFIWAQILLIRFPSLIYFYLRILIVSCSFMARGLWIVWSRYWTVRHALRMSKNRYRRERSLEAHFSIWLYHL